MDHLLERQLDEARHALFDLDHPEAVLERSRRIAVGDAPNDLVGEQEAEPDRELEAEVAPSTRQIPVPDRDDSPGHAGIPAKLVPATAGPILTCPTAVAEAQP